MRAETFVQLIGSEFYAGVPDSQLKALCSYLIDTYGTSGCHHIIAANEGNAVALAGGYHLATGKLPVVYLQNSGIGNIINPVTSLMSEEVYGIPCLYIVGWRGEPGVHDEPQHAQMGKITPLLLKDSGIATFILDASTTEEAVSQQLRSWQSRFASGQSSAFLVRKGGLCYDSPIKFQNQNTLRREEALQCIVKQAAEDILISTTGKASRELFEIRERRGEAHQHDFLTVGSMGHTSSIALAAALYQPKRRVWCIDGDGAVLMHLGAMALIGSKAPKNLLHIVINNSAHESVGGMPTVASQIDLCSIARACGYPFAASADSLDALESILQQISAAPGPCFLEVRTAIGSRPDLGRPTQRPGESKDAFMAELRK